MVALDVERENSGLRRGARGTLEGHVISFWEGSRVKISAVGQSLLVRDDTFGSCSCQVTNHVHMACRGGRDEQDARLSICLEMNDVPIVYAVRCNIPSSHSIPLGALVVG